MIRKFTISLVLLGLFSSCLKEDQINLDFSGYKPKNIGDGWRIGTCKENSIDSLALSSVLSSAHENDDFWAMRSIAVYRNNSIIAETYLKDQADRITRRPIWSCTKQVLSLGMGILFDETKVFPTDRIGQFLSASLAKHKDKENILIQDLLTMRSGIAFDNDKQSDVFRKQQTANSVYYVLGLPLKYKTGSTFNYNDGDPQLLSAIIQSIERKQADVFIRENIFEKIGFSNYEWRRYKDGVTLGAFGILTTPRELAKIGQLVLNKGSWDSTQVVSENYINEMLTSRTNYPKRPFLDFGYDWWIHPAKKYYIMWGHGGQYVIVMPDKNAMVVITGLEQIADEFGVEIEDAITLADRLSAAMN